MNRDQFLKMLIRTRKDAGVDRATMSFKMKILYCNFRKIESPANNSSMDRIFEYLWVLHKTICLNKDKTRSIILNSKQFCSWLSIHREELHTRQSLAEAIGASRNSIYCIEQGKTLPRIDMFLKIVETLGYTVTIEDL